MIKPTHDTIGQADRGPLERLLRAAWLVCEHDDDGCYANSYAQDCCDALNELTEAMYRLVKEAPGLITYLSTDSEHPRLHS
jgi:hypothetical protein